MANVLKAAASTPETTTAARRVSGLAGFNLNDLADEGRTRLKECQTQVESMLQEARAEAEKIKADAKKDGYEEGLVKASKEAEVKLKTEAKKQASQSLKLIEQAVAELHRGHEAWMNAYVESLHTISLAAAEKICRRELSGDQQLMITWAREAVHSARSASRLSVAVHPETLVHIGEQLDELLASPELPERSQVVPDASLGRTEVSVRQTGGEVKAGLEAQLERLTELLG